MPTTASSLHLSLLPLLLLCACVADPGTHDSTPSGASGLSAGPPESGSAPESPGSSDTSGDSPDTSGGSSGMPSGSSTSGTATTTDADAATTAATDTGEEVTGEELYLTTCAPCHGMNGEGTELGYGLQHPVRDYSTWVVRNGRPGEEFEDSEMAAFDTSVLSDELLEEIWDYLDAFPQPATGEGLYLDYCRNCHGVDATGGVVDQDISSEGFVSILDAVRMGEHPGEFEMRDEYMPAFDSTQLTDDEVQLIADHIASL